MIIPQLSTSLIMGINKPHQRAAHQPHQSPSQFKQEREHNESRGVAREKEEKEKRKKKKRAIIPTKTLNFTTMYNVSFVGWCSKKVQLLVKSPTHCS